MKNFNELKGKLTEQDKNRISLVICKGTKKATMIRKALGQSGKLPDHGIFTRLIKTVSSDWVFIASGDSRPDLRMVRMIILGQVK
jgi:hypothetical protein